jgi:LmbE family N-acetylglucosaminyl deacetylase
VREVHIIQWQWEDHHFVADISETIELKLAALACHQSQLPDFAAMAASVRARCAAFGKPHGYAYAEPFDRIVPLS